MKEKLRDILAGEPGVATLVALVDALRPRRREEAEAKVRALGALLEDAPELAAALRACLAEALADLRFVYVLVESGILEDRGVASILWSGVTHTILPRVPPPHDARSALAQVFRKRGDWRWVREVPTDAWALVFSLVLEDEDLGRLLHEDVALALRALAQRVAGAGTEQEIDGKLAFVEDYDSPFLELPADARAFILAHRAGDDAEPAYEALEERLSFSRETVQGLREDKKEHGTSLRLTRLTRRMDQQLQRLELLIRLVHPKDRGELAHTFAELLCELVEAEREGRRVRRRVAQSIDLLAYQITEHTAAKSAKYIGAGRAAYRKLLWGAMVGGAIVGPFAIAKLLAGRFELSLAAKALVYGLNYAVCFVCIYLAGATLATKQPAVTASAIAKALDESETRRAGLEEVAERVVFVWRNQFVSFLGNLLCAFPAAVAAAYLAERAFGGEVVNTERAQALLLANHPWDSPALVYAGIAGVFLFLAGLIQGAVDNRVVYTRLTERLAEHPRLAFLGGLRGRFAKLVGKHAGGLASNVALGFLLGSAGVVGKILGLPIQIRHIAFSSAHVGVSVLDAPQLVDGTQVGVLVLGVLGIGFVNFIVSFGLTMAVTLKSRRVTVTQGRALAGILLRRFWTKPLAWFVPV